MTAAPSRALQPVRVVLTPRLARVNRLNGAWWPYTRDITLELGPMLSAVAVRIGPARGVLLSRSEWAEAPLSWRPASNPRIRVSWYGTHDRDVVIVVGHSGKRIDLLLVPPAADDETAELAMEMAGCDGNQLSATDTLRAAGVSV